MTVTRNYLSILMWQAEAMRKGLDLVHPLDGGGVLGGPPQDIGRPQLVYVDTLEF